MFLPEMKRSFPLVYLQRLSAPHQLDWGITQEHDGVAMGKFGAHGVYQDGHTRCVTRLLPRRVIKKHPVGEIPTCAKTFLGEFMAKGGQYLANDFRMPGWVHSAGNMWWACLVKYMLDSHGQILKEIDLYPTIRNVQYDLLQSSYHLFSLLEMYNSETDTFYEIFTGLVINAN